MPPLKETRLQIQERNRREIRQRTNKRLAELAQETERNRQGSSCTQQEDEIEDKDEDKNVDKIEDKKEDKKEDKIEVVRVQEREGLLGFCFSVLRVLFLVILFMFALSAVWHVGSKRKA